MISVYHYGSIIIKLYMLIKLSYIPPLSYYVLQGRNQSQDHTSNLATQLPSADVPTFHCALLLEAFEADALPPFFSLAPTKKQD